jgi:hypothetical protein
MSNGRQVESGWRAQKRRLTGEDDLDAGVVDQPGEQVHRRRGGAQDGGLGVPHHVGKHAADVFVGALGPPMLGAEKGGGDLLVGPLVVGRLIEGD